MFVFGKAFDYDFFLLDPDTGEHVDLSAVTDAPTAYLYDYEPTRSVAMLGTGALQTVSVWTNKSVNGKSGKTISFAAIPDPADGEEKNYWIAVNYKLVNSGAVNVAIQPIVLTRPIGQWGAVSTAPSDLKLIHKDIDGIASNAQQLNAITLAIALVQAKLQSKGIEWARLHQPSQLNLCVSYYAVASLMLGEMGTTADRYDTLAVEYKGVGKTLLEGLELSYKSVDGTEKTAPVSSVGYVRIVR